MDPVTIVILSFLLAIFSGGAGRQIYKSAKKRQREQMREAVLTEWPGPERYLSVFDLFWDLGASDWALTIMGHQDLLPRAPEDVDDIFRRIEDRIKAHGSYAAFVEDVLDAIQEFYEEHRTPGDRRMLPTLETNPQKLLPMDEAASSQTSSLAVRTSPAADGRPDGLLLDIGLEERERAREARSLSGGMLVPTKGGSVDIDDVLNAGPLDILKGLFQGNLTDRLTKWIKMRDLRGLRAELDDRLTALYRYFEQQASRDADFFAPLYDLPRRWEREALRLARLESERPWRERPFALAADVLVEEARILARYLARHAKRNADEAIEAIRERAAAGDEAMAGYLVYTNRFALFAGRGDEHASLVTEIEYVTSRIRAELRDLQKKRVL